MLVKLTSKGQMVIPKTIRQTLGLASGARLEIRVVGNKIILEPLSRKDPIEELRGIYAGEDLLGELEAEHRWEIEHDREIYS